jgi:repressor of nif and glnA expression
MPKTKEVKREQAEARAFEKRSVRAQIRHLDEKGLSAKKERARLNKLLEKSDGEKILKKLEMKMEQYFRNKRNPERA